MTFYSDYDEIQSDFNESEQQLDQLRAILTPAIEAARNRKEKPKSYILAIEMEINDELLNQAGELLGVQ